MAEGPAKSEMRRGHSVTWSLHGHFLLEAAQQSKGNIFLGACRPPKLCFWGPAGPHRECVRPCRAPQRVCKALQGSQALAPLPF